MDNAIAISFRRTRYDGISVIAPGNELHSLTMSPQWTAGVLALPTPSLSADMTCAEVFDWFNENATQAAAAVVDEENRVVGLTNRLRFLARYARRYTPELYGRHSIMKMANAKPLIVDEAIPVSDLATTLVLEWPDALRECFVVTREGRYLGIGTSEALVRCKVDILIARERELKDALLRATEASQTKSHFLALMSHELRTPLNAIIGFSEVLSNEFFGPLGTSRYREYATDIHGAGRHLLALINDILDLSKAEAGKLELQPEPVDVAQLIRDCVRLTAGRARERRVRVTARVAQDLPFLLSDVLRIKQVMLNLMTNAIKFTPSGGQVDIGVEIGLDGGFVLFVKDTGIGMAPETIPIALEPFRQISSPFARNSEGTGLGLSLVKVLTELHGGALSIDSALSEGTTVRVLLPPSRTLSGPQAMTA